ncbi:BTB and MATH domain-containing protein 40 [Durusdinium trenchii]|uniref:E3 ubiquitin-protein ligase n=1 Tax=Durusdinium trenchii TaxID=1381693 RepID=A0ABP0QQ40_9DINO
MLQHIMKSLTVLHVCWLEQVASDLLKEKILESVLTAVQRLQNQLLDVKDGVTQAKGLGECGEMWNHWFRMLHDLGYLFYHASVCQYFLATQAVQEMVVELMVPLWRLCAQKREERAHILYERRTSEGFLLEIEILRAMKPFSDFCRRPEASFQELRPWYSCLIAGLKRCSNFQSTFNCAAFSSFHLPLLRLLSSCMHWELLQNAEQPGDWRELFPSDFLVHSMTHLVRTLRFEAEIQNGLWVRNGQSMHKQQSDYRQNLRQWDILAFQACMLLMDLYEEAEPLACLWTAAFEEKGSGCSVSALDSWKRLWSDEVKVAVQLRFRLFWTVLAQALNEMMPIEVSLCRRRWESRYARCSVILQRFFIQILAKPMSVAELTPLIPKELQAREPQVTEVLDLVALRKDQKFQLKAKSWAYFDCLMASTPAEFDWTCMVWRQMGLAS